MTDNLPSEAYAQQCFERGAQLVQAQMLGSAQEQFEAALVAYPAHRDAALGLAFVLRNQGRYSAAADVLERFLTAIGPDVGTVLSVVQFLRECQLRERAFALWERHLGNDARAVSQFLGAELAASLGDFERAADLFDACLQSDPSHAGALFRRAHVGRIAADAPYRRQLSACVAAADQAAPALRIAALYASAKLAADDGRIAQQMDALAAAKTIQRRIGAWDVAAWRRWVDSASRAPIDVPSSHSPGQEVVFIVGLPRTGTTLLARLLAEQNGIVDRGELPWFEHVLAGAPPSLYLAHLRQDDQAASRYIDKNPLNFRYLGWIAQIFPQAHIVCCTRDPRDSALSAYEQYFAHDDLAWSTSWENILAFQHGYQQLMRTWSHRLGRRLHRVAYEALVNDPHRVVKEVLRAIGVPSDQAVSASPAQGGAIATASVWQARQAVTTGSVQRWRRHTELPTELLARYGDQAQPQDWDEAMLCAKPSE